ncbi:NKAP family protein-like [Aphis gossypii]|uniref:NKAP family protein-like n=1 Tax=Aphis gossypii TaxID=80765 RepID=UPI0021591863|nr:NKAP family protein-like [Aphis gossypii]
MSLFSTIQNKSVNFEDDKYERVNNNNCSRYDGRGSNYERDINYQGHKRDYRDKSPYPRSENRRNRESSIDRRYNRDRSLSRDRDYYNRYQRESSPYRSSNSNYRNRSNSRDRDDRGKNYNNTKRQYSRDNSRERTPEQYRDNYEKESKKVTCYKCNEKGHYTDRCISSKND